VHQMVSHGVKERVDERIGPPAELPLSAVLIEKAREAGVLVLLQALKVFNQLATQSDRWVGRRKGYRVLFQPIAHQLFIEPHIQTFVGLLSAEDRMQG